MKLRVWYTEDRIFDVTSVDDWDNLPELGILAVAAEYGFDEHGRKLGQVWTGSDWYWMYEEKIYSNGDSTWDIDSWVDVSAPSGSILKRGKWTTDEIMDSVMSEMVEWVN